MNRRGFLIGGAGVGAAALAGLGYRAWDRGAFSAGEGEAYEAWAQWRNDTRHADTDCRRLRCGVRL